MPFDFKRHLQDWGTLNTYLGNQKISREIILYILLTVNKKALNLYTYNTLVDIFCRLAEKEFEKIESVLVIRA